MKQQLHYHISLARLTLFATFGGLLLILMFARSGAAQTQTFNPTNNIGDGGNVQTFTVPTGVTSLTITAKGSVGGGTSGGKGATVKATFAVTPGALLKIVVGAKGRSSTNNAKYGGGGGGSFVAVGDINEANLLIAAGGGGGGGLTPGGDASTTAGNGEGGDPGNGMDGGGGGGAGIKSNGGDAGFEPCMQGAGCGGYPAGVGGSGGFYDAVGGFGGGGGAGRGGGGGGGYSGGAGGNESENAGGGGGSSYTKSGATAVSASVNNTGVGQVIIEWTATINPATPNDFITTWANTTGSFTQLQFNALTTGPVAYSYTTSGGQSGSGTFTSTTLGSVTLTLGNTIAAGEMLTLVIEPTNLQQVQLGANTTFRSYLTDIPQWGSTAWTSMRDAFKDCINLNITATDVPNLSGGGDMSEMFRNCSKLNSPANIGTWNVSNVTNMESVFSGATIFNQNISGWNVGKVTTMNSMFQSAAAFNQPISTWDISKVTNTSRMFNGATAFNQPIGNWGSKTAAMTDMSIMFYNATTFNQDISTWNVSSVTTMNNMFNGATAFSQNLGRWTLKASVDLASMLLASGMNCENYSKTLVGWANNPATPNGLNIASTYGLQYGTDAASAVSILTGKSWNFGVTPAQRHTSSSTTCIPAPTLTAIPNQATCDGQTISNIAIEATGDIDGLSLAATSSNAGITPTFTFGGSGANRTLTIASTSGQIGATTITVTATNSSGGTATKTFVLELGNKSVGTATLGAETTVISQFNNLSSFDFGLDNNIYVTVGNAPGAPYTAGSIAQFSIGGMLLNATYITGLTTPARLHVGKNGKLYFINNGSSNLTRYNGQTFEANKSIAAQSVQSIQTNSANEAFYLNFASGGGVLKLPTNYTDASPITNLYPTNPNPNFMVIAPTEMVLYYVDSSGFNNSKLIRIKADGSGAPTVVLATPQIRGLAFDESGQLWISHAPEGKLSLVDLSAGTFTTAISSGFYFNPVFKNGEIYYRNSSGSTAGVYKEALWYL